MGVGSSKALDQGVPEAGQLLHAVKKGEHLKALRLVRSVPDCAQTISPSAKAAAVHSAVKRGHVSILQFLRDLPSGSPDSGSGGTSPSASHAAVGLGPNGQTAIQSQPQSSHRPSRLSYNTDASHDGHAVDANGRHMVGRESWLNALDRHGRTPLFTAVRHNRLEFVEGLTSLGADPWATDRTSRGTPLHLAAVLGHAPLVAAMLKSTVAGPDPRVALYDVQDVYGFTPLHYAAATGHADVARVLLDAGASYTAASHHVYDPSPGLRRLTSLTNRAGFSGLGSLAGSSGSDDGASAALPAACAPRSNPLHLAALRGDGVMATLVLQKYLADTDGLPRAQRDRVTDPRTQLNKDGFQPYMLAGNAGHWHVAQLLIPHSRDDRHHLSRNRDRDFLIFFPLPEPPAATAAAVGGEGPPSLAEIAGRVWGAKLLADVKSAEATVRQLQHSHSLGQLINALTASPVSFGGGGGAAALFLDSFRGSGGGAASGVLGALLRRSGRTPAGVPSPVHGPGANSPRRATLLASTSLNLGGSGGGPGSAAWAASAALGAAGTQNAPPAAASALLAPPSPVASAVSTPRTSASGAFTAAGGGLCRNPSPPRRAQLLCGPTTPRGSRRTTSLDLTPRNSGLSAIAAANAAAAVPPPPPQTPPSPPPPGAPARPIAPPAAWHLAPLPSPSPQAGGTAAAAAATVATAPGSPVPPAPMSPRPASMSSLALCDVCFEQLQELALRPCPHRMCASCCRRVVEMHCAGLGLGPAGAAAVAARAPGRRPAAAPPRCPFCQATIRGFAPAATAAAATTAITAAAAVRQERVGA